MGSKSEQINWVINFYRTKARLPKVREVSARFGLSHGTAWKIRQEARMEILIVGARKRA